MYQCWHIVNRSPFKDFSTANYQTFTDQDISHLSFSADGYVTMWKLWPLLGCDWYWLHNWEHIYVRINDIECIIDRLVSWKLITHKVTVKSHSNQPPWQYLKYLGDKHWLFFTISNDTGGGVLQSLTLQVKGLCHKSSFLFTWLHYCDENKVCLWPGHLLSFGLKSKCQGSTDCFIYSMS